MVNETATFALNGDVPLDQFVTGIRHWAGMLAQLSREVHPDATVEWIIEDLQPGSATTTARAVSDESTNIRPILTFYSRVARDMEQGQEPAASPKVREHAQALVRLIGPSITSIRFETSEEDVTIHAGGEAQPAIAQLRAYGAVAGRIQTMSSRRRLSFTLYDSIFDRAVNCYLQADQQHLVADKWDQRVVVDGIISRDPDSGRPVAIRAISAITILSDHQQGDYRDAAGLFPLEPGEESAVVVLHRIRDAW